MSTSVADYSDESGDERKPIVCFLIYSDQNEVAARQFARTLRKQKVVVFAYPFEQDSDLIGVRRALEANDPEYTFLAIVFGSAIEEQHNMRQKFGELVIDTFGKGKSRGRHRRVLSIRLDPDPAREIEEERLYSAFNFAGKNFEQQLKQLIDHLGLMLQLNDPKTSDVYSHVSGVMETTAPQDLLFSELKRQIQAGHIDQKFLYWDVRATLRWQEIADSSTYMTAQSSSNMVAINSGHLVEAFLGDSTSENYTFINFGVGTGVKDFGFLRELLVRRPQAKVLYVPIDESLSMLQITIEEIQELAGQFGERLKIHFVLSDFKNAKRFAQYIVDQEEEFFGRGVVPPRLVAFLGGSLGNFHETTVLGQVKRLLQSESDRLILDAEFVAERSDKDLAANYSDRKMQDFLFGPIFDAEGIPPDYEKDFSNKVLTSRSDVPGARTIVGTVKHRGKSIELFSATKYLPRDLLAYLGKQGFAVVAELYSNERAPTFGQFLLSLSPSHD